MLNGDIHTFYGVTSGSSDYFFFFVIARGALVIISVITAAFCVHMVRLFVLHLCSLAIWSSGHSMICYVPTPCDGT